MPLLTSAARRSLAHMAAYALAGPVVSAMIVVSAVAVVAIIFDSDTPEQGLLQQLFALALLLLVAISCSAVSRRWLWVCFAPLGANEQAPCRSVFRLGLHVSAGSLSSS